MALNYDIIYITQ